MQWNFGFAVLLCGAAAIPAARAQQADLREAARLDQQGRCEESEPLYQRALSGGDPSVSLLNNLGNHYLVCGNPAKAREYFEKLRSVNPSHTNANLQLARIATEQRRGKDALDYLANVRESGAAIDLLRAEALHWAGRREEALAALDAVSNGAHGDARVLFTLGLACARLGLYPRAESAFAAVLKRHPGDFDVLLNLGRAAARAEHYDRAVSALDAALGVRSGDPDALFELGRAYAARRDSSRAVFVLAQARQKAPGRADILLALARAAEDAEYYGDAALAFDEYLALRPGDDIARRDHARVCARTESRRKEGLNALGEYIAAHPDDPRAHYDLAHLIWESKPEEALAELAKSIRLDPQSAGALVSRAWLLNRLGRTAEAVPHLEAAIRIQPDSPRALDQLGLAYLTLDRPAEAEGVLRKALGLAPDDAEILLHLGKCLAALGRRAEAGPFLERFRKIRPAVKRDLRTEPGMIELASLAPDERRRKQIERFRQMADSRPDDPELKLHLGGLLLADGRDSEALAEFQRLLQSSAGDDTRAKAGRMLLSAEHYDLARQFLDPVAVDDPSARVDLAAAVFHTEGPEAALAILEESPPESRKGDYLFLKAGLLDALGRGDEASNLIEEGLGSESTRPELVRQGAALLVRQGRENEALGLLDRAAKRSPDQPELLLAKAILLALLDRDGDSAALLNELESRWPEWDGPYLVHGLLMERRNRPDEARQSIRIAATLNPANFSAMCALDRLAAKAEEAPECRCVKGLVEVLIPACGGRGTDLGR